MISSEKGDVFDDMSQVLKIGIQHMSWKKLKYNSGTC